MSEYIEREAAIDAIMKVYVRTAGYKARERVFEAEEAVHRLPAADVAPVVRCKDCKHHYDCGVHFCDRLGMDCPDDSDFFCSYGKRKDGGADNETD